MILLDCETTGLDPTNDVMLELGMLHVTDDLTTVLGEFQTLVRYEHGLAAPMAEIAALEGWPSVVRDMHIASGLFDALDDPRVGLPDEALAERLAIHWLERQEIQNGIEVGTEPMCGSSIHFDRGFLKIHMREFASYWHYRNIDTSTVKELVRRWRPEVYADLPEARKLHRVLPDCYDTLNELRFYKARVMEA